ncbi:mucin-5AC isoform X1 [Lampris incognitus]|uniref:mucin-5AC isoform X1 n=1 Tax=Lampris incognitus TaxID=2546036 RepID=UPI0024B52F97|nr:mucin-5AC isoform X1 [Lampris incognitus]
MAAFLLRLGRMGSVKCLQLESWGILRRPSAAALCNQAREPKKPAKKAKAASKTVEAPDERASLLAYKTAVAFPVRLSTPGFPPVQALGETETTAAAMESHTGESCPAVDGAAVAGKSVPLSSDSATETAPPVPEEAVVSEAAALVTESAAGEPVDVEAAATKDPDAISNPDPAADSTQPILDTAPPVADGVPEIVDTAPLVPESVVAASAKPSASSTAIATEPATDGTSSSSSSDSDSDSGSDSDSDIEEKGGETQTGAQKETQAEDVKEEVPSEPKEKVTSVPDATFSTSGEGVQEAMSADVTSDSNVETAPRMSSEELVDSASKISAATEQVLTEAAPEVSAATQDITTGATTPLIPESPAESSVTVTMEAKPETTPVLETAPEAHIEAKAPVEGSIENVVPALAEAHAEATTETPAEAPTEAIAETLVKASPEATAETLAEVPAVAVTPVESAEELVDPDPAVGEAAGEELQADAHAEPEAVEPSEEAAAAAAPTEPEEPFDISTYKNNQHHDYNPFTFADLDVEMAKFRLPQPSSGKLSPQH